MLPSMRNRARRGVADFRRRQMVNSALLTSSSVDVALLDALNALPVDGSGDPLSALRRGTGMS